MKLVGHTRRATSDKKPTRDVQYCNIEVTEGYRATWSSRTEGYQEEEEKKQPLRVSSSQPWQGLCLQTKMGRCPSGNVCEQSLSPRHAGENGSANRRRPFCYSAFWWQDYFSPCVGSNEFGGNCPGRTWCKTFEEPLAGQQQRWKRILEKLRKDASLKVLAGAMGEEILSFPNLNSKEDFPVFNRTRSIINRYSCVNCISAPSISVTKNLVFWLVFFWLKGRLITNAGSVTNMGLMRRVLLMTGFPLVAHSPGSEEEISVRGDSVEECFFVSVSSTCQQSPGKPPSLLGLLSVSNTSSLESEAWMLFFKP